MRIAYLAAGAAGMYCGSCLHDNTLAAALLKRGEDLLLIPTYTPIRTDENDVSQQRVFFGGINAYLQQSIPLFRYTPRWLDKWFDHPALLNFVTKRSASVDPAKLGPLTVSMLRGEEGNQRKELDKLVDWLIDEVKPDVVHLSNSMLLGMARRISQRCGPPVVCSLSGEDIFLEKLKAPHYEQARDLLRERAAETHAFTALNGYYADYMADYLSVPRERVHVIPHGLDLTGHASPDETLSPPDLQRPVRIGYLARICHDKGLHLLVEATEALAREGYPVELHAAGYLGKSDRGYFQALQQTIDKGPLAKRFTHHGELNRDQKIAFLRSLDLFSTPTVYRESKGLPALEALANGVPVVLPNHGSFPEIVQSTGGGLLHEPDNGADLAQKLRHLVENRSEAADKGQTGQAAIHDHYHADRMAEETLELYRQLLDRHEG